MTNNDADAAAGHTQPEGDDSPAKKPAVKKKATKKKATKKKATKKTATERTAVARPSMKASLKGRKTADLGDSRRLSKKAKDSLASKWSGDNAKGSRDVLLSSLAEVARDKFGADRVYTTTGDIEKLAIGIPTPSLPFEYIVANDIFPLRSVMMLSGPGGCCKSALAYEFFRWFYHQDGIVSHIDTEDKVNGQLIESIMDTGNDPQNTPILSSTASSLENMQSMLIHYVQEIQRICKGTKLDPGPGKTVPALLTVDSLVGATSEKIADKVLKEGQADRTHPLNALLNSIFLPAIKQGFFNWPMTLLIITHLKKSKDERGFDQSKTLGGESFNFHESFELRNSVWKKKIKCSEFEGVGIQIECAKNSFGPTGRKVKTRMLWWLEDDPETQEPIQRTIWDWNWSICNLLHTAEGVDKRRLKEKDLTINCKSPAADVECLASMPALGMGRDEYLPFQEVGQMIHDNEEVSNRIRQALGIQRRHVLDRPMDAIEEEYQEGLS